MIKSSANIHASLDTIYSEIIQLAGSVGECKASIEHLEDVVNRCHYDLKESMITIDKRFIRIEEKEKEGKWSYFAQFFQLSLSNLFKWTCLLITIGIFVGSGTKINFPNLVIKLEHYLIS